MATAPSTLPKDTTEPGKDSRSKKQLRKDRITGIMIYPPAVALDGFGEHAQPCSQCLMGPNLVLAREAGIPGHISVQDRYQLTLDRLIRHVPPSGDFLCGHFREH